MEHSFDIDLANEIGIEEAIIFKHICYWIQKNEANEKNQFDGDTWTYNSVKAFNEIFFYMTEKKIRNALAKLEEFGLIKTGNYNKIQFDRTKWYALTEKGKSIFQNRKIHLPEKENGNTQKGEPIPNINHIDNTDSNNTNNKTGSNSAIESFFDDVWKLYPKKKGKGQVSLAKKGVLFRIGKEELSRCIDRYKKYVSEKNMDEKYVMYGSTFFNSGYVDYLDENYTDECQTQEEIEGAVKWQ